MTNIIRQLIEKISGQEELHLHYPVDDYWPDSGSILGIFHTVYADIPSNFP